jgi:hypothetical protein
MKVDVLGPEWPSRLPAVAEKAQVIVNGTDDLAAGLLLYRTGRAAGRAVIDAYTSPLPSVTVVRPGDPMPEERLGFPTCRKAWHAVRESDRRAALLAEFEYVLIHSSARRHIEPTVAAEVVTGRRSPMSFATMDRDRVLMAHGSSRCSVAAHRHRLRGWFSIRWAAVERPPPLVAALLRPVWRFLARSHLRAMIDVDDTVPSPTARSIRSRQPASSSSRANHRLDPHGALTRQILCAHVHRRLLRAGRGVVVG